MKLYIDTTNSKKIIVKINGKTHETDSKKEKSQKLLLFIEELLKRKGKTIEDISEVGVNTGPGSFTGIRVGVSVAQAIGWILNIPVNGVDVVRSGKIEIKYK